VSILRYAAIGDSFTEGIGDEMPDGTPRGWADQAVSQIARSQPVEYVNLAIRGRLLRPIATDQLDRVLALEPDLITFNGGGNDLLRPRVDIRSLAQLTERVITRCQDAGVRLVVLSGANPSQHLPFSAKINTAGLRLQQVVSEQAERYGVELVDNFTDLELSRASYWSPDRLHLNADGHRRVAARLLTALGYDAPTDWFTPHRSSDAEPTIAQQAKYYREHVAPWVWRHLRGRSSGDGVEPKFVTWTPIPAS
jgi:lysophospholipase L1-like esterase